ncbi:hypothetical protein MN116_002834, partial [Schistosoma mekongi]
MFNVNLLISLLNTFSINTFNFSTAPPQNPLQIVRIADSTPLDTEIFDYVETAKTSFTIISGKLYYFSCRIIHANPKPIVTWYIRHSTGEIRQLITFTNLTNNNNSKQNWKPFLNFVDTQASIFLTHEDDGSLLKCIATNSMGSVSSEEVILNIEYMPIIYPFESNPIRVLETTSFKQVCRTKANPSAQIYWVDENYNLISNNSTLNIHHINRNGPKQYNCIATNKIGETNQKLLIDVLYPPIVHVQPKVTVNEGEALEIACRADANPSVSSIYWTYNKFPDQKQIVNQSNLHWSQSSRIDGSILKIPYTYPYHAGLYYCHAVSEIYMPHDLWLSQNLSSSNEVWSIWKQRSRSFAEVNLTINYPPGQPTLTVLYTTNNKGEDYVKLSCQENKSAPGQPSPTFHWLRTIGIDEKTETIEKYSNYEYDELSKCFTISLSNLSVLDSGIYSCFVQNELGSSQLASVNVLIKSKPILINKSNEKVIIELHHKTIDQFYANHHLLDYAIHIIPSNNMNCTFLSSLSTDIQWLFHNNNQYKNNFTALIPINNSLLSQWTKNSIIKNKFGLWMIITSLHIQLDEIIFYIMKNIEIFLKKFPKKFISYSWNNQILKQLLEFLIIIQFEGNYLCEASNSIGIEYGLTTLHVQKPLNSLISFSEVTSVYINEHNAYQYEGSETKLYGPLFCQFYGKPALNQIIWWRYTGLNYPEQNTHNDWKVIYQIENFNDSITIKETPNLLIITGTPALIPSLVSNFSTHERQSSYESFIHDLYRMSYRFTMFTILWLKKFNHKDYGYYKCQSKNEIGSNFEIRQFRKPGSPPIITELYHIQSTWTSVTIFWKPNEYYNSPINLQYHDLFNNTVNNIHNKIQHLLSIWLRKSQYTQKYFIHLEDYGIVNGLSNETTSSLLDSLKSLNNSINANYVNQSFIKEPTIKKIVKSEFLINTEGQNYVNISGLMSNHLYTVTISRVNQYGQSKPSKPLAFKTKALHLELPGPIHLDETKEIIQFSKGNPAICAQVEMGTTKNDSISSTIWNSIHFSSNYSPYIIVNKNIFYSEMNNKYVELSNCKPLSWNHYTEISIRLQQKYHLRARYCIYGYNTICTEYIQPIKDISMHIVIVAALLCITL